MAEKMETSAEPSVGGDDDALLNIDDVAARYAVHPRTVPVLVKENRIPPPVEGWTGAHNKWLKSEIVASIRAMRTKRAVELKK